MLEIIHFVLHAAYARLRFCIMHSVLLNEQQRCAHLDIASLLSLIRGKKMRNTRQHKWIAIYGCIHIFCAHLTCREPAK